MDKHNRTKRILKIVGGILLFTGAVFAIIGFVDFFGAMNSWGSPSNFWCLFVGLPLMAAGGGLLMFGFRREVAQYMEKEHAPVVNEAAKDMSPAVKTVASAVKEGLSDEKKVVCSCGAVNGADSKFCKECGKPLAKICPACGATVSPDSVFCDQCGQKIKND